MVLLEIFQYKFATGKNIIVAAETHVTAQARLKVYEYLNKFGQSVLHCNTGLVIFVQKYNNPQNVKTDDYLGDLTDQL